MEEDGDDKDDSKRKSRNLSEKKRRDQFNALVNDLSALISTTNRKMDKSTVLKSTIAFLKHHNEATDRSKVFEIQQDWKPSFLTNDEFTHLMLESLDGFIIVFSSNGSIFYASESITSLLGYLPADLLNMSIFDLSYELDHECLLNIFLNPKPVIEPLQTDINSTNQISFHIHLKRGGIDKVDANAYELVKFVGYFRNDVNIDSIGIPIKNQENTLPRIFEVHPTIQLDQKLIFVGTGRIQTPQLIREMSAIDPSRNEFTSKHSMEWKFLFLDHRAPPIIGYMPFEVLGTSGYDYYHFDDLDGIVACHEELMQKGEGKSCYYRFLTKGQQWIWLQTDFYISYHQFNSKPDYVVCTHKVVSYADVIRQNKCGSGSGSGSVRDNRIPISSTKSTEGGSVKSATITLGEFDVTGPIDVVIGNETNAPVPTTTESSISICSANTSGAILNEPPATLDIGSMWANTSGTAAQPPLTPQINRTSRPSSSYGNISSTGISPTVKRKRYLSSLGNESDSTSMSADSGTSKNSLLTHLSSQNRQRNHSSPFLGQHHHHQQTATSMVPQLPNQATQLVSASASASASFHHQQHTQLQTHTNAHAHAHAHTHTHTHTHAHAHVHSHSHSHSHAHGHTHSHSNHSTISQMQTGQKIIPVLPQQQVVTSNSCQFTQTAFPSLRSPQIVAPSFLEPSQYLTAIPVQPVIAPFPVASVLSPITTQPEIISNAAVVMTPTQAQIQEQLQRKHDELQKLIMQQQDELRIVSEQLLLARYTLLQPVVPMAGYNNSSVSPTTPTTIGVSVGVNQSGRNYNFINTNGPSEPQFSQYGFTMSSDAQISNQSDPQIVVQQQQQQQQQNIANAQHHLGHMSLQQHSQNQQPVVSPTQQIQTPQTPQHNPTSFLSRSVPDLDQFGQEDIDAFLNLSPLHSISGSQNVLNHISVNGIHANNNNSSNNIPVVVGSGAGGADNSGSVDGGGIAGGGRNTAGSSVHSPLRQQGYGNNTDPTTVGPPNEDTLLSYMQMAAESSPTLNFPIGISEDESETQSEDTKLLPHSHAHTQSQDQQQQQQQQQNTAFFSQNAFQTAATGSNSTSNHLPNDLEILPYQMSQEQSQNLFNSPSNATGAQQ